MVANSYALVLGRACYACQEMRKAVVGSIIAIAINIVLSATFLPYLGARGLLLANGVSALFMTAFLATVLWRMIGGFEWRQLLSSFVRVSLASFALVGAVYWIGSLGVTPEPTLASRASYLAGLLGVAAVVFLGVSRALGIEELTMVVRTVLEKLTPRAPGASET